MPDIEDLRELGSRMIAILGLSTSPVGVRFLMDGEVEGAEVLHRHRYCQALMRARHGRSVILNAEGISCPAAARAFGFRPLPEPLRTGRGLVSFGIVSDESVARRMFEDMPHLEMGAVKQIHLYPLEVAKHPPDLVVVEGEAEKLMWIVLSYMHSRGGERVQSSTAVLQATCVDSTVVPYIEKRLNFSLGCYGCRDATDMGDGEVVLGFPASYLPEIVKHLEFLSRKALPHSREKHAFAALKSDEQTGCSELTVG
ncbi:MAG: DUF169 domain-containing protein [Methanothrix sp.]|jgi:Uncharacterized protein conserved in archaea|uniref:DUF169 domain-containing protein n=1 Tax=Methanothrix thermoacetophila (strain DSM 6194 / JCM 14653 / NBRC 101360 / PT) TaxID=349307 RepID=A0B8I6_METTP|nr:MULTISPECIES: DUF169 domain-containing protein [Methanothrix]ABK15010.1 protein of unknown function DUF169 [Methanothrix thermoacetophila PT]MBC7079408.1 DUF169 domain-containing protein [Methanothrix sp.]NPU86875.1 DUF169 domain-containing protein [Methanothrix sp.]